MERIQENGMTDVERTKNAIEGEGEGGLVQRILVPTYRTRKQEDLKKEQLL